MLDTYLNQLDGCYVELDRAFNGLRDKHLWKRPAPPLLSVGELAGHIAYWQAVRMAGQGEDVSACKVVSPLVDARFRDYDSSLENPPSGAVLALTAAQVRDELMRVHRETVAHFRALDPNLSHVPRGHPARFSYGAMLTYRVFHTAYHTGQIYSVRHLLGEKTAEN